jgi:pyrroline-5-carboxylate reductase
LDNQDKQNKRRDQHHQSEPKQTKPTNTPRLSNHMSTHKDIAFIGGGNMAGALIEGLLKRGVAAKQLHVIDVNGDIRAKWRDKGLSVSSEPDDALKAHTVWMLAVKPQQLSDVIKPLKAFLQPHTIAVSIAAGISLVTLSHWLGSLEQPWPLVVRAMPNTPALVEKGMTGLVAGTAVSNHDRDVVHNILSAVGDVVWVESDQMIDAVTGVSGSGPAYVFRFIEAMMVGAKQLGLDDIQAKQLTLATLAGATELAAQSSEPVSTLRERVTSKGGTTAAALSVLEAQHFENIVTAAMQAAYDRAGELSRELGNDT